MATDSPAKERGPWEDYAEKESGPWEDYGGKSSIVGAPEGLPSAGAPETIANIIPEEEAARRLRGTVTMRGNPTTMAASKQEKRLLDYNPGGQLMTAAMTAPSSVGLVRGAIRNPALAGKILLGGAAGGAAGGYTGREVGGIFGPRGREIGGEIGGALGSLAGGYAGAKGMRVPSRGFIGEMLWGEKPPTDPLRLAVREGRAAMIPTRMRAPKLEAPEPPVDPLSLAVREGRAARLPVRMTPFRAEPELGSPENPGWVAKLSDRMPVRTTPFEGTESVAGTRPRSLILTPEEAKAESQMQSVATKRAKERGMQFAGGMTPREGRKVPRMGTRMKSTEFPEPRERIRLPE